MKYILFVLFVPFTFIHAQNFRGLDKSPMDKTAYPASHRVSDKIAVITYSRPQLRGRTFSEIVPSDKVWRTGANEATELRVFAPIAIGKTTINPGTYSIFTLFENGTATLIVNAATNIWGSYSYSQEKDIVRITVPYSNAEKSLEAFSMVFSKENESPKLYIGWDKIRVEVPFTVL
jgi:hypothetical protein